MDILLAPIFFGFSFLGFSECQSKRNRTGILIELFLESFGSELVNSEIFKSKEY
jgi:hypothetical protein